MPEQPPDPLHYDMKIPPEPKAGKQSEGHPDHGQEKDPNLASDNGPAHGDDHSPDRSQE
jgi:hypothetical protein